MYVFLILRIWMTCLFLSLKYELLGGFQLNLFLTYAVQKFLDKYNVGLHRR